MKKASRASTAPVVSPATKSRRAASSSVDEVDEMRAEYDFRGGVRGKYADRFAPGQPVRLIVLAPDVAAGFRSARAVNAALRKVLKERATPERSGRSRARTA
jgi:hypothetical protein